MRLRRYFMRRPIVPRPTCPPQRTGEPPVLREEPRASSIDLGLVFAPLPAKTDAPKALVIVRRDPPHRAFPFHRVHHHRPGRGVRKPLPRRLALIAAVAVNTLALAALGAGLYVHFGPAKSSENNLRSENASHKLKATSAVAAAVADAAPPPPREAQLEEPPASPPPPLRPEPEVPLPEVVEQPALAPVPPVMPPPAVPGPMLVSVPAVAPMPTSPGEDLWQPFLVYSRDPGETPMLRTWKMLKLASALTAALAVTPVSFAQEAKDSKDKDTKTILERIDKLDKDLLEKLEKLLTEKMQQELRVAQATLEREIGRLQWMLLAKDREFERYDKEIKQLTSAMEGIKKKIPAEGTVSLYPPDKALEEIKARLDQIEKALGKPPPGQGRVAMSPPAAGRVVMINLHVEELLFRINGQNYRVAPGRPLTLEGVPAGPLNYEVISPTSGLRGARNTQLSPNETVTLTAQ